MANGNNSGSGWEWFWLVVVIAVIGSAYLYQREGGKIFGPDGLTTKQPQELNGFQVKWDSGFFSHDFLVTNNKPTDLDQVDLTFTFYREDGER